MKLTSPSAILPLLSPFSYALPSFLKSISPKDVAIHPDPANGHWVDTWTAMPQLTEYSNLPPPPFNQTNLVFPNTTLRQTFHITTPASQLRIQISNAFSPVDLPITAMTVALPLAAGDQNLTGSSFINTTTLQPLTFSGKSSITISPGALAVSDPLNFPVNTNQVLSISMYLAQGQASSLVTSHPGSRTSSWISFGDYTSSPNMTGSSTQEVFHWYFLSAVQAWQPPSYSSFAVLGDSLTDGRGSYNNANQRWTDRLFTRMQREGVKEIAVLNQAAGGNHVLTDGNGPNLWSRVGRDVLSHPNVKYALIWEGVNDIGTRSSTASGQTITGDCLTAAYEQLITQLHTFNIPVFGATITPFGCANATLQPYSIPTREATRQRVNKWIRESGRFDAFVDFDKVVRDPRNETRLRPEWDLGDCLHFNGEGYEALAEAFPVQVFGEWREGVSSFI